MKTTPALNWKREPKDARDFRFAHSAMGVVTPNAMSNRPLMSPPKNQSTLGCCVGEGSTSAVEYTHRQWGDDPNFIGSELYCYWNARTDKNNDTGGYVRDSVKAMSKVGIASEQLWPFDVKKFRLRPPPASYADGSKRLISQYQRLSSLDEIIQALAQHHVVVGGFDCYKGIFACRGNKPVPIPGMLERSVGGHCVCFCGYNKALEIVEFKNSWGSSWGDGGYGYLPFWYFQRGHVDDCWVLIK